MGLKIVGNRLDQSYVNMTSRYSRKCCCIPTKLFPFNQRLTPPACWTSVHFHGIFLRGKTRKNSSLLLPESLTGSPCRDALLGRCSDWIQMLLECGRGQETTVEASVQHWLIDRGQDEVGSHISWLWSLNSFFLSYALTLPHLSCVPSGCLLMPVFYVAFWVGVELSGDQTALCWLFASPLLSI